MVDDELGRNDINEVIIKIKDNIIYVDLVLLSMVKAVEEWYDDYYQDDKIATNIKKKSHTFCIVRYYDRQKFVDYKTIGLERQKYLEWVDLHVQMRRED